MNVHFHRIYVYIFQIIVVSLPSANFLKNDTSIKNVTSWNKQAKFWTFGLIRIENSICIGVDGLMGTCYTRWQCKNIKGIISGKCANRVGTCCVVQRTCGETSSYNNTYFVNPRFPSGYNGAGACTFVVRKCNPDICQIRIDFLCLTLSQPNAAGYCVNDAFFITGGASLFTPICGDNNGQHVYMGFNGEQDIKITIFTSDAVRMNRSWKLKVAQIGCGCPTKAPSGCLMYYTALTGTVRSFNYAQTVSSETVVDANGNIREGTRQIANTNYGICIAMAPGYCGIRWMRPTSDPYSFTVSGDTPQAIIDGNLGTPMGALQDCMTDFVVIPHPHRATDMQPLNTDRFCGNGIETVISYSKPFVLTAITNGNEDGDFGNRGFNLMYTQVACGGNMG